MKSETYIIIGLSVLLICFWNATYKRVYQTSKLNNKKYLVRSNTDLNVQLKSANLLASLSNKKHKLCDYLEGSDKYNKHYGVNRLLSNRNVKLEELSYEYNNEAAYSINKGERIGICLRKKSGDVEDENTMFFVLMHELAHIMSRKYAHDKEFWDNFALLIEAATESGLYKYRDFGKQPTTFCGHSIRHTPK